MKRGRASWTPLYRRRDYIHNAAWFFYRATDSDDNLKSALYRMQAEDARKRLMQHCEELPSADEVYQYAKALFPADRLHDPVPDA